jgi:hypothetical protein
MTVGVAQNRRVGKIRIEAAHSVAAINATNVRIGEVMRRKDDGIHGSSSANP